MADPLRHFGVVNKTNQRALIADILEAVNMRPEYMDRYPMMFGGPGDGSGSPALLVHPEMVICDEAVSALDVSIQAQVLNLLMRLKEELKLTYIFITHNLSVVEYISDRIAVMYLGRIVELASTEQIFENTMHPYTEALLSAILWWTRITSAAALCWRAMCPTRSIRPRGATSIHAARSVWISACTKSRN